MFTNEKYLLLSGLRSERGPCCRVTVGGLAEAWADGGWASWLGLMAGPHGWASWLGLRVAGPHGWAPWLGLVTVQWLISGAGCSRTLLKRYPVQPPLEPARPPGVGLYWFYRHWPHPPVTGPDSWLSGLIVSLSAPPPPAPPPAPPPPPSSLLSENRSGQTRHQKMGTPSREGSLSNQGNPLHYLYR